MTHNLSPTLYETFLDSFRSLILATVDPEGNPEASYAPYIRDNTKNFYLLASELASHTANLLTNPQASILFIEDEDKSQQIFGRRRLSFNCQVKEIQRTAAEWEPIIGQMQITHGDRVTMIASLADFHLFQLIPTRGRFVQGFGGIYTITGEGMNQVVAVQPRKPS